MDDKGPRIDIKPNPNNLMPFICEKLGIKLGEYFIIGVKYKDRDGNYKFLPDKYFCTIGLDGFRVYGEYFDENKWRQSQILEELLTGYYEIAERNVKAPWEENNA